MTPHVYARVGLGLLAAILAGLLMLLPSHSPQQPPNAPHVPPRGYVCYRAPTPITIDGHLNDPAWEVAPWSEPFVDIEGDRKPAPRFRTRVKMLWDDVALYIA